MNLKIYFFSILVFFTSPLISQKPINFETQLYKGEIKGLILDEKGEPVPFAQAIIIEDFEGIQQTKIGAKADVNGNYSIKNLPNGFYNIMFRALGMKKKIETRIRVSSESPTSINCNFEKMEHRKIGCMMSCQPRKKKAIEKATIEIKDLFSVYPNPSHGFIYAELPKNAYKLEIYDLKGLLIYSNSLKESMKEIQIDLNPYSNGIYNIICTSSGGERNIEKIELQK